MVKLWIYLSSERVQGSPRWPRNLPGPVGAQLLHRDSSWGSGEHRSSSSRPRRTLARWRSDHSMHAPSTHKQNQAETVNPWSEPCQGRLQSWGVTRCHRGWDVAQVRAAGAAQPHRGLGCTARIPAGIHQQTLSPQNASAQPHTFCGNPLGHNRLRKRLRAFSFSNALVQTRGSEILGRICKQTKLGSGTLWSSVWLEAEKGLEGSVRQTDTAPVCVCLAAYSWHWRQQAGLDEPLPEPR